ncbi:MAG: hypothetical protein MUO97_03625 [Dehalococcoidia bacterium]|nr:hypothetical protein [Dehalococcoidia bacterium]
MAGKQDKVTANKSNCKSVLAKVIFGIVLGIVFVAAIGAALVRFSQFLQFATPALVFITGISWALRTANVHQYKMTERSMEAYIWHYNHAKNDTMRKSYKRIIEHYAKEANADLPNAKLFSYITLYLFFSVLFLFATEMLNFIFYHGHLQCLCACWAAAWHCNPPCIFLLLFLVLSFIFLFFAGLSLYIRLRKSEEKGKFTKCFKAFSACFANNTYVLEEDWQRFPLKEQNQSQWKCYEKELKSIIQDQKNAWLRDLLKFDKDC